MQSASPMRVSAALAMAALIGCGGGPDRAAFGWSPAVTADAAEFEFECIEAPALPTEVSTRTATDSTDTVGYVELVGVFESPDLADHWLSAATPEAFNCIAPDAAMEAVDDLAITDADRSVAILTTFPNAEFAQLLLAGRAASTVTLVVVSAPDRETAIEAAMPLTAG